MTAPAATQVIPFPRQAGRRPVHIEVERHELVGFCLDADALASEVAVANGAAIENLLRLPAGPERDEALLGTHRTHNRLVELLKHVRMGSARYESARPIR